MSEFPSELDLAYAHAREKLEKEIIEIVHGCVYYSDNEKVILVNNHVWKYDTFFDILARGIKAREEKKMIDAYRNKDNKK